MLSSLLEKIAPTSTLSTTFFPPAALFSAEDMPDLSGKVIIVTESGYDLQWGTNLPALKASKLASGTPSRVINTSSLAHGYAPTSAPNKVWEVDTFVGGGKRDALIKKWGEYGARSKLYGQSKAGNIAHANYLGREHAGDIVACSLHPGMINSELQRHLPGFVASIVRWMSYPLTMGALTQINTGTILTPEEINGKYYQPWGRVGHPTPQSIDPARADEAHQSFAPEDEARDESLTRIPHRGHRAITGLVGAEKHEKVAVGAHEDDAVGFERNVADLAKLGRRRDEGIGLVGRDDEQALLGPANKGGDSGWLVTVANIDLPFFARLSVNARGDGIVRDEGDGVGDRGRFIGRLLRLLAILAIEHGVPLELGTKDGMIKYHNHLDPPCRR
ncbi:hypothetical protein MVLG_05950 [Microbotryum lychnidis-dioicae p1A1 Lamole]|uniref:Uncharacterized protein n=1 Tax=Microbotryum lychnidis-dioicae (strain p1A1 Lamole / MvSl-1064) TaxID=683840 RepID=U5HFS4_USTV1|nr:hypothetical protein MVLG_05950 [Microbotryum lychnidis-dioicae p1A1 Lamole]|eukprot:KDE03565.1 hypothetical protein MVLG_05950 [Microbotryum lychnidis-dioicae p1A1 Lamole]